MDHDTAKFAKDTDEQNSKTAILDLVTRSLNVGPKMANPAFRHWAVFSKCSNHDDAKKEAVFEGLKEDGQENNYKN